MKFSPAFHNIFKSKKAGGLTLIGCTLLSLLLANTSFSTAYLPLWEQTFAGHDVRHWINEGLMTFFFLLTGLELKSEIFAGRLS